MTKDLRLVLVFLVLLASSCGLLWYLSFLPDAEDGKFLGKAVAVINIPGVIPNARFTFMEFNRTFNDPSALDKQNQPTPEDTKVYLVYNGVPAPDANINWGNRLQVQIVEAGDCDKANRIDQGYPNCIDDVFLHDRKTFNNQSCPQSELTCMHGLCGCGWRGVLMLCMVDKLNMLRTTDATVNLTGVTLTGTASKTNLVGLQVRVTQINGRGDAKNQLLARHCAPIKLVDVGANLSPYVADPTRDNIPTPEGPYHRYKSLANFSLNGGIQDVTGQGFTGKFSVTIKRNDELSPDETRPGDLGFGIMVNATFTGDQPNWPPGFVADRPIYTLKFVKSNGCQTMKKPAIDVGYGLIRGVCFREPKNNNSLAPDPKFNALNPRTDRCAQGDMSGMVWLGRWLCGGVLSALFSVQTTC
jgi:hypothetical protein